MGLTNPAEQYFNRGLWGWLSSQWRKLGVLWGYSDKLRINKQDLDASVTEDSLYSDEVPAGEVWVLQAACAWDATTDITDIRIIVADGTSDTTIKYALPTAIGEHIVWTGEVELSEGDQVAAVFRGTVAGDTIRLRGWGYKMAVV